MNKARRAMMCLLAMTAISLSGFYGARADVLPFPTWNVNISFAAGGGSGYMSPVTKTYTDNGRAQYYTLPSCKFIRTGYAFAGWRVQDSCSPDSGVYMAGYSYKLCGGDLTLTATWKSSAKTHVLTLYRNNSSGDGAGARRTVAEGSYYTLPTISSLGWTRSGYTFRGWATYRGASYADYGDGASVYVSSSLTSLYAVWEDNTHVMTLYRNNSSGDGAGAKRKVPNGGYYTLPTISSLGWTRSGYAFKGWATYRGATSADYDDGERIYVGSGLSSLYAVWEDYWQGRYPAVAVADPVLDFTAADMKFVEIQRDQIVPIIIEANGGTGGPYLVKVRTYWDGDMDGYTLPACPFTRYGYKFVGWEVYNGCYYGDPFYVYERGGVDCGGGYIGTYQPGFFYYVCASTVLRAKWAVDTSVKTHVMTLYRNNSSGDGAGARRTVTDGGYYTLPTTSSLGWTRSGYTFRGWATYRGGSVEYYDGERIYVSSALSSLYAVWQSNTTKHVLTLYRNNSSGDGAGARRKVPNDGYYTLPTISSLGWTRSGYAFKGWATYRGASATYGDGDQIYVGSGLASLYAVWEDDSHVMTLYRNNSSGDGAGARRKVPNDGYYTLPTISSLGWARSGYAFKGWATYRGGSATYGDGDQIYVGSGLASLYAVWEDDSHVMTLYRNNSSGDGAGARRKVPNDGYYTLPTISSLGWVRSGYTFKGWATYRGGWTEYDDGEWIYVSPSLYSLYAVWEYTAVKYIVRLHRNNSSGDGATASRTMIVGSWRDLPTIDSLGWQRPGRYFAGWSYYPDASYYDICYGDGESVSNLSDCAGDEVHLYAVWQ